MSLRNNILFNPDTAIRFTILYDNYVYFQGTRADWGFSCLIEGTEQTILFDTGLYPNILLQNIEQLNVDIGEIDVIVISHNHGDHTGGLFTILDQNPNVVVYLPQSFPNDFVQNVQNRGAQVVLVDDSVSICNSVYSTGEMGSRIREQSLVLDTSEGLIVITGCSHPGIVRIVQRAKEIIDEDISIVFGGFHLMEYSDGAIQGIVEDFRNLSVQRCGPTHCTGDHQIQLFREAYGDHFVQMGVGRRWVEPK